MSSTNRLAKAFRIERDPDDVVVPWRWEGQVACAAVFLLMLALICIRWAA